MEYNNQAVLNDNLLKKINKIADDKEKKGDHEQDHPIVLFKID